MHVYVEILSTWEVWRTLKRLELPSAMPQATLPPFSCSPNFPRAQYLNIRMFTHALIVNWSFSDWPRLIQYRFSWCLNLCAFVLSKKSKKIHQKKKCPFLSGDDKWEHVLKKSNITTILWEVEPRGHFISWVNTILHKKLHYQILSYTKTRRNGSTSINYVHMVKWQYSILPVLFHHYGNL